MMTTAEKIAYVQAILDDPDATDALIGAYLLKAASDVFARMYGIGGKPESVTEVPERYEMQQCELAIRKFLRRGGQGEMIHNENGTHRHYGSVNDEDILMEIVQVIRL